MSTRSDATNEWNGFILAHRGSFLQSSEWGDFQMARGRTVARIVVPNGRALAVNYRFPGGLSYVYLPHGPVLETVSEETLRAIINAVRQAAARTRPLFIRVEPLGPDTEAIVSALTAAGFRRTEDAQPSETRYLDLTQSDDALLAGMEHDTRYAIRAAEKRGVRIRVVTERSERAQAFKPFWNIFRGTAERHELTNYPEAYYRDVAALTGECSATLFLAELEGSCISGAISVTFGDRVTYLYAASASGYGKYNAPSAVLWALVREAKRRGARTLDLWGESDSKPKWQGISAFKRSFGGAAVRTAGTWDYPLRPFWYRTYRLTARSIR
jgi:lipid II:glycine glycyltransferase (peptidoglycan interpeptide bridge formation enzyme)